MASPDVDISTLSDSQQVALQTYTSVTDQDLAAAIPLLQRSQWNVQFAIARFFDGEAPDPVEEARARLASSPTPSQSSHRETLLNGSSSFPHTPSPTRREPAPRIVPQPERAAYRPPLLFAILLTPFNVLYRLVTSSLGLFGFLFPFLPRLLSSLSSGGTSPASRYNTTGRRPLNPRDTASRFVREFEEEYGSHSLQLFDGGYAQAYDLAKKELKFLLVLLISPEHDDTSTFVRETLLSQEVVTYVNDPRNGIILWAGSVQDSEAYQVSNALNCSKFPFAALIAHTPQDSSSSMSTVARITGLLPPSAFVPRLRTAITQHSAALDRVRGARAEQQATRNLREEQNSAYERSLTQDRERTRQRREVEATEERLRQEAVVRQEAEEKKIRDLDQWRRWRAQKIPSEPSNEFKNFSRVSIRMQSGERVIRRFTEDTKTEELYAFVECYETLQSEVSSNISEPQGYEHVYNFRLVSPMPRTVYDLESGGTVGSRLGRSGNLIVEPIDSNDEDDDGT